MASKKTPSTTPTETITVVDGDRTPSTENDLSLLPRKFDFFAAQMKHELDRIRTVVIPALDRIESLMRELVERVERIESKQHELDRRVSVLEGKQTKRDTRNSRRRKTAKLTVVK